MEIKRGRDLPVGGKERQVLAKSSDDSYDTVWMWTQDLGVVEQNEYAKYYGLQKPGAKITGGSEGAPDSGYEDFNGDNLCHYFGIAAADTWTTQNSDTEWIKYTWKRKYGHKGIGVERVCFTPKKPIGYGGNWADLYLAGVVYGDGLEAGEEGEVTSSSDTSITDTGKSWDTDEHQGKRIAIIKDEYTGSSIFPIVDDHEIDSNTSDTITIDGNWDTNPGADNVYIIYDAADTARHHNREMSGHEGYSEGDLCANTRQDKWIEIDGAGYTVRLMEGGPEGNNSDNEPTGDSAGYGSSEWNTIMYSIVNCANEGHQGGDHKWEQWSNDDVGIGGQSDPNGRRTFCQETSVDEDSFRRVSRGFTSVVSFLAGNSAGTFSSVGLRLVLELL